MPHKILSVDDSKTIRMIIGRAFKAFDCEIIEAADGQQGLDAVANNKPDLIILDITMPVMTGIEMLTKLKADPATKDIPVIMLTAESGKENVAQIAALGPRDYLTKPFKEDVLLQKAKAILPLQPKPA